MNKENGLDMVRAAEALRVAAELQPTFWDSLEHLENMLGIELVSTDDLAAHSAQVLLAETKRSDIDLASIEAALDEAKELQQQFWDALRDVEQHLGVEIDGTNILGDVSVDELVAVCRRRASGAIAEGEGDHITVTGQDYTLVVSLADGKVTRSDLSVSAPADVRQLLAGIDRFDVQEAAEWVERYSGRESIAGDQFPLPTIGYWKQDGRYEAAEESYREDVEASCEDRITMKP